MQTVYVHRSSLYDKFVEAVVAEVRKLKLGDPLDPATDVGTLIDEGAPRGVWNPGSTRQRPVVPAFFPGGKRHGAQIEPTVIGGVRPEIRRWFATRCSGR